MKYQSDLKELFKDIPSVLSNILSIITFFGLSGGSILSFGVSIFINETAKHIALIVGSAFSFLLICFLTLNVFRYRKKSAIRISAYTSGFYKFTRASRELREKIVEAQMSGVEYSGTWSSLEWYAAKLLELLLDMSEPITNQKLSACIKLIEPSDIKPLTPENMTVKTFCRSSRSDALRGEWESGKTVQVRLNTDFYYIIENIGSRTECKHEKDFWFYEQDLSQYAKRHNGKDYHNQNPDWKEDYIGTCVFPISGLEYNETLGAHQMTIIGFVCMDSLSKDAFPLREDVKRAYRNLLAGCANEIFGAFATYKMKVPAYT